MELAKRAVLVSLSIKLEGLLGERRDAAATSLVESTYSVAHKRAKASKYLIDRKHPKVKAVVAAAQQVRAVVYRYTFPWGDSGLRLLPAKAHAEFQAAAREALNTLHGCQEEYLGAYPSLVTQSKLDLNGMFDASQYPGVERVRTLFKASVEYWPMPQDGHFVADIATEAVAEARATMRAETIARTNTAINDMIGRVEQGVKLYVDKLSAYQHQDPEIRAVFRDSLVSNTIEMGGLIRKLNFMDDPGIDVLANHVERLGRYTADTLRESQDARSTMISEGQALLNKLDSYRKLESQVDDVIGAVLDYQ